MLDHQPSTAHNSAPKAPTKVIIVPSESTGQDLSNGMGLDGIGRQKGKIIRVQKWNMSKICHCQHIFAHSTAPWALTNVRIVPESSAQSLSNGMGSDGIGRQKW